MRKTVNLRRPETNRELADRWLGCNEDDLAAHSEVQRPRTRADCEDAPRPCPWVGCRYSLYLDVKKRSIKLNFPALEVDEMPAAMSCALDVADSRPGGADLPVVAQAMGLSYDRSFQVVDLARKHAIEVARSLGVGTPTASPRRAKPARTADPDLDNISAAAHRSTPAFKKAPFRQLAREEVAQLFPGADISANYGKPQPQVEAAPRDPRAALRASMRRCLG